MNAAVRCTLLVLHYYAGVVLAERLPPFSQWMTGSRPPEVSSTENTTTTQGTESVASPVEYYAKFVIGHDAEDGSPDDSMMRIRRDFNNDGRIDEAIAFESVCGNKMCNFDVWLQDAAGRYKRVGTLPILPWGYGLRLKVRGVAELQRCSGTGVEFWGMSAWRISMDGITYDRDRSKTLSEAGECRLAKLGSYPCERCSVREVKKSRRCRWTTCE